MSFLSSLNSNPATEYNMSDIHSAKSNNGSCDEEKERNRLNNVIKFDKILSKMYEERSKVSRSNNKNDANNENDVNEQPDQLTNNLDNKSNNSDKEIIWHNILKFAVLHIFMLYGLYLILTLRVNWKTILLAYLCYMFGGFGVTAGSHRLWSHRSYKANLPLRIFLMIAHTSMFQNNIYHWCREHRTHHKYTDTNADPHNSKRGVFYSHIGWLMFKKTKEVINAGKTIDFSDILEDPVVQFQIKYYYPMVVVLTFALPTLVPWYLWNEDLWYSFVVSITRFMWGLNSTFLVNSFAHAFGSKPFDTSIKSTENKLVSILSFGEGWHNYHHVFPWDYKAAEFGSYELNFTTCFIDVMAKIGWATDLKTASEELIKKRKLRTGCGSYTNNMDVFFQLKNNKKRQIMEVTNNIWGWGDKDMAETEKQDILIKN